MGVMGVMSVMETQECKKLNCFYFMRIHQYCMSRTPATRYDVLSDLSILCWCSLIIVTKLPSSTPVGTATFENTTKLMQIRVQLKIKNTLPWGSVVRTHVCGGYALA